MIELSYPAFVTLTVLSTVGSLALFVIILAAIVHLTKKK